MIKKLLKLADELDKKGLYTEASLLDRIAQQIINIPESAVKPIIGNPPRMKSKTGPAPQPVKVDPFAKTPPIPQVQLPQKEYKPIQLADDPGFVQNIEDWELELMNMEISPEAREKEREYKKHEVPTDPSELEGSYRQVSNEELYKRTGPVKSETQEKIWPGSQPKHSRDLPYNYKPKNTKEISDWLAGMELGSERPLDVEEEQLDELEQNKDLDD